MGLEGRGLGRGGVAAVRLGSPGFARGWGPAAGCAHSAVLVWPPGGQRGACMAGSSWGGACAKAPGGVGRARSPPVAWGVHGGPFVGWSVREGPRWRGACTEGSRWGAAGRRLVTGCFVTFSERIPGVMPSSETGLDGQGRSLVTRPRGGPGAPRVLRLRVHYLPRSAIFKHPRKPWGLTGLKQRFWKQNIRAASSNRAERGTDLTPCPPGARRTDGRTHSQR